MHQEIRRTGRGVEIRVWLTPVKFPCNNSCRPGVENFGRNVNGEGSEFVFVGGCLLMGVGIFIGEEGA